MVRVKYRGFVSCNQKNLAMAVLGEHKHASSDGKVGLGQGIKLGQVKKKLGWPCSDI